MENLKKWFNTLFPIGELKSGGVTRLGYSKEEDLMHKTVLKISKELGLHSKEDGVGNKYIYIDDKDENYILIGSHLDSVLNGGRYDGVAGVLGGLLVLKWIKENNLNIPVKLGIFRCEESSVFGTALIGSSLASGIIKEENLHDIKDKENNSLYNILKSKGYLNTEYKLNNIKAYFEIHIEQGRVLWDNNIDIGIVKAIAAPQRFKLAIKGRQDHSGATPMDMRKDALCGAAEIILAIENYGKRESKNSSVATVGICNNFPNVMNVIPGVVELGIDIRGIDKSSIDRITHNMKSTINNVMEKRNLSYELTNISGSEPVILDKDIISGLMNTGNKLGINCLEMPSGAGHDAMNFAEFIKTGMIFIPNQEGISHNPEENIRLEDLYRACRLLYEYLRDESQFPRLRELF